MADASFAPTPSRSAGTTGATIRRVFAGIGEACTVFAAAARVARDVEAHRTPSKADCAVIGIDGDWPLR